MKNEDRVVCMLLAGGQGSRLKSLTNETAKPAVPFGGKYAIIDFALSNCRNSGITDVGVLTQYKPFRLHEHLGIGSAWDLDRNHGGLRILSPYYSEEGGAWYAGTADSLYENIDYLDYMNPQYVLVLSGDHIYKMDYNEILDVHKKKGSECTIAVMEVPWEEAPRFGIMNADANDKIVEFEEKPAQPKSNLASMGIYVFNWKELRAELIRDHQQAGSSHDFGKDIIPYMLEHGHSLYVYRFDGYWKDVGTVKSYWQANLEMINPDNGLAIYDKSWRIYTYAQNLPAHYISESAEISNSLVNEACQIYGKIDHSVLFTDVTVEEGAEIKDSVILSGCTIKSGAHIYHAVLNENETVEAGQTVGRDKSDKVYLLSNQQVLEEE